MTAALRPAELCWRCDAAMFDFQTTAELPEFGEIIGQARATDAVEFGVTMQRDGYNLFMMGPSGVGKRTVVERCLKEAASDAPTPSDWCYVNNFEDLRRPRGLALPPGRGVKLRNDMQQLIDDLNHAIPAALESDEHRAHQRDIVREASAQQETAFEELSRQTLAEDVQFVRTPDGFALAPMKDGEVLKPNEYEQLTQAQKDAIQTKITGFERRVQEIVERIPEWSKDARDKIRELNRQAVKLTSGPLLQKLKEQYADLPEVLRYLESVERDILEQADDFSPDEEPPVPTLIPQEEKNPFEDYDINLLVDNSQTQGAPIIAEDHPTYQNIIGRVEHETEMGALLTDFTLIKGGALHRANGGYLILDALRLLEQPFAWEGLKRALQSHSIRIEPLGEALGLISTVSLEPDAIPLSVKVVLLGDRMLYYMLEEYDPDFAELFKVAADFEDELPRTTESCQLYAKFVATLAKREKLRPLSREAVARTLEHSARVAEDSERLTAHMRSIADVLCEADHWAERDASSIIQPVHIQRAINEQQRRVSRVRDQLQEEIRRGTILIDTSGERVGQINGLSVLDLGSYAFGQPSRITATVRLGKGDVIDVEREVKLGGAIHSKGVLILSSFLATRFGQMEPLSVSVSLAFEQSYGQVDGDSASIAELCVLLSAIGDVPIKQSLAVTGSVNQLGQAQPIGGVNEKIEGFFDVCRTRGLTGEHGVVIPATNVKHLMLRQEIQDAVAAGQFNIYAVENIDQAVAILTGVPAGDRDSQGAYPVGSVNQRVAARLAEFGRRRKLFDDAEPKADTSHGESSH